MDCETKKILLFLFIANAITSSICESSLQVTIIKPMVNDSCGINTGGPLVQQMTTPLSYVGSMDWVDDGDKIAYVDRYGNAFGRYTPSDGHLNHMTLPDAKAYTFVFPANGTNQLLFAVGQDKSIILVNVTGSGSQLVSTTEYLMTITNNTKEEVITARTDSKGNLWISTGSRRGPPIGKLYRIDSLQKPVVLTKRLHMGAGMAWSPDEKYFYLVDARLGRIYRFDYNKEEGTIDNRTIIFNSRNYKELWCRPFDITMSNDNTLWIGMFGCGTILQYDPSTGEILWKIPIPASDITSVTFGNMDKKTLYVGTAYHFLRNKKAQPGAGAIYAVSGLGVAGRAQSAVTLPKKYL